MDIPIRPLLTFVAGSFGPWPTMANPPTGRHQTDFSRQKGLTKGAGRAYFRCTDVWGCLTPAPFMSGVVVR